MVSVNAEYGSREWYTRVDEVAKTFDPEPVSVHPLRSGGSTEFFQVKFRDRNSDMVFGWDAWLARTDPERKKHYDALQGCLTFNGALQYAFILDVIHRSGKIKEIVSKANSHLVENGYVVLLNTGAFKFGPNEMEGAKRVCHYGECLKEGKSDE